MGQNFLVAASLDIILERGERGVSGLSPALKIMFKVGLTAEKIDIEFNLSPEKQPKMKSKWIAICNYNVILRDILGTLFVLGKSWTQCQFSQPSD